MGFVENLRAKYELYKLEQRYTRRDKRTTFTSSAQYVDGEYVYSPTSSTKSASSFGSGASKRMSTIQVKEIFAGNGHGNGNQALALATALLASSNDAALRQLSGRLPSYSSHRCTSSSQRRLLSSSQRHNRAADVDAGARDGQEGEQEVQKQKVQRKGTFAGYEALMGSMGNAEAEKLANDAISAARSKDGLAPVWRAAPWRGEGSRDGDVGHVRPTGFDSHEHRQMRRKNAQAQKAAVDGETGHAGMNAGSQAVDSSRHSVAGSSTARRGFARGKQMRLDLTRDRTDGSDADGAGINPGVSADSKGDWKADMHRIAAQAQSLAQHKPKLPPMEYKSTKDKMDYEGFPIASEAPSLGYQIPCPWAINTKEGTATTGMEMLNREIKLFAQYLEPTPTEKVARRSVRDEALACMNEYVENAMHINLFGSETTGLSTAASDLDFRLGLKKTLPVSRKNYDSNGEYILSRMKLLTSQMTKSTDWIATVFRNARFPIINTQHRQTGIDIQIVSSPSTESQRIATERCLLHIPNLTDLYFVVKTMLGMRGLVDVFNGGTGSYGLFIMLVASLTRRGAPQYADPGQQLLQFLDFWSDFDYARYGVALSWPTRDRTSLSTVFLKHDAREIPRARYVRAAHDREDPVRAGQWSIGQRRPYQPYLLCLQDPASTTNDLGRKSNAIKHIVATLQQVRTDLRATMEAAEKGELSQGVSILEPVVGRCHEVYYERRKRVEEIGLATLRKRRAAGNERKREREEREGRAWEARQQQKEQQGPPAVETAWAG